MTDLAERITPELLELATAEEIALLRAGLADEYFPEARPAQRTPAGAWQTWLLRAGRGFGKTRSGAEWVVEEAIASPGTYAVAAPTFSDGRDICVEGESGILAVLERRHRKATWNRSLGELRFAGSRIKVGSADEPDRFRGWNFAGAWCDELAAWRRPDAFTQIRLATRLGRARIVVTTTPRPTKLVKDLLEAPTTVVASGSTFDNAANLTEAALDELRRKYEGTRIGRQELYGELLLDTPGALWTPTMITQAHDWTVLPPMRRIVVAVDPAVTSGEDSDATGIVAVGLAITDDLYVLDDRTCRVPPMQWARRAIELYDEHEADRIVAEVNNGGDLVTTVLRTVDPSIPVRTVHASRGKRVRAEPVAALYEQGRVHHVAGLGELEDQMTTWTPDSAESPDRLDALVWAITELAIEPSKKRPRIVRVS